MFKCRVCFEKDLRIQDLLSQVEMLRKLAVPETHSHLAELQATEMDRIMSGSDTPIQVRDFEIREADRLMAGNYDNFQVEVDAS